MLNELPSKPSTHRKTMQGFIGEGLLLAKKPYESFLVFERELH